MAGNDSMTKSGRVCQAVSDKLSILISFVGLLVVVGWIFDVPFLKSILPTFIAMKFNTALCFILTGLALWLSQEQRSGNRFYRLAAPIFSLTVLLAGMAVFFEYCFSVDLGIDQFFIKELPGALNTTYLGRLALTTAINFMLIGAGLLFLKSKNRFLFTISQSFFLVEWIVAIVTSLAYLYGANPLFIGPRFNTAMAIHAVVLFNLIALSAFFCQPNRGFMGQVTSEYFGGVILRRLIPIIVLVPALFDWLDTFIIKNGSMEHPLSMTLIACLNIIFLVGYGYFPCVWINEAMHRVAVNEDALHQVSERLLLATRAANIGIWDYDIPNNKLVWDNAMYQLYGITAKRFGGAYEAWKAGLHPEDLQRGDDEIQMAIRGEKEFDTEFRVIWPDKSVHHIHALAMVQRDTAGRALRMVGTNWDITERKQSEQTLAQSEEKFRLLLNSTAEGIYGADLEGKCTICNRSCASLLGYKNPEELIGKHVHSLMHHSHADGTPYPVEECKIFRAFRIGEGTHADDEVFWRADGSSFPVEYWAYPQRLDGVIVGVVATFIDVTERKKIEAQLLQSQKMEAVGQLAGGIAHDFNNLLTVINGYSQMIFDKCAAKDPIKMDLKEVVGAGQRAKTLVSQLLTFSRRQVTQVKAINLNDLILDTCKTYRRLIPTNIELVALPEATLGTVKIDPNQLDQALSNLLVNATHAMPDGGKITMRTTNISHKMGDYILLTITDTGTGMSEEVKKHLFEPFFTTKEKGKGTGLGLATIFGIVKQSGGFIEVESELGHGTTFKVHLPIVSEKPAQWYDSQTPAELSRGTETILVIEDEEPLRNFSARVLRNQGYEVLEASNGAEAIGRLKTHTGHPVKLVLTDIIMPQMGGKEAAEKIRKLYPDMRIIFTSGYTDNAEIRSGQLASGTTFLQKPFSPRALAFKVREALDG